MTKRLSVTTIFFSLVTLFTATVYSAQESQQPMIPAIPLTRAHFDQAHNILQLPDHYFGPSGSVGLCLDYKTDRSDEHSKTWREELLASNSSKESLHLTLCAQIYNQSPPQKLFLKTNATFNLPAMSENTQPVNHYSFSFNEQEQLYLTYRPLIKPSFIQPLPTPPMYWQPQPLQPNLPILLADLDFQRQRISGLEKTVYYLQKELYQKSLVPKEVVETQKPLEEPLVETTPEPTQEVSPSETAPSKITPETTIENPTPPSLATSEEKVLWASIAAKPAQPVTQKSTQEKKETPQPSIKKTAPQKGQPLRGKKFVLQVQQSASTSNESSPLQPVYRAPLIIPTVAPITAFSATPLAIPPTAPVEKKSSPKKQPIDQYKLPTTLTEPLSEKEQKKITEQQALKEEQAHKKFLEKEERANLYQQKKVQIAEEKELDEKQEFLCRSRILDLLKEQRFEEAETERRKLKVKKHLFSNFISLLSYAYIYPFIPTKLQNEVKEKRADVLKLIKTKAVEDKGYQDIFSYFLVLTSSSSEEKKAFLEKIENHKSWVVFKDFESTIANFLENEGYLKRVCSNDESCIHKNFHSNLSTIKHDNPKMGITAAFYKLKALIYGSACSVLSKTSGINNKQLQEQFTKEAENDLKDSIIKEEVLSFFDTVKQPFFDSPEHQEFLSLLGNYGSFHVLHVEEGKEIESIPTINEEHLAQNITTLSAGFDTIINADTTTQKKHIALLFRHLQATMTPLQIATTVLNNCDQKWAFHLLAQSFNRFSENEFRGLGDSIRKNFSIIKDFPGLLKDFFKVIEKKKEMVPFFTENLFLEPHASMHHHLLKRFMPHSEHPAMPAVLEVLKTMIRNPRYTKEQQAVLAKSVVELCRALPKK